eukprot:m.241092 g.241092  ORF g.241092 m.241092 type:complete len:141 (-) comp23970_c0_seq1:24-446(-)
MALRGSASLLPARFMLLVAHFIMAVSIFWSRERNLDNCLAARASSSDRTTKENEMIAALSLMMVAFAVELVGFLSGASMFSGAASILSIALHASGAISLAFFVLESMPCSSLWYIFGFCSAPLMLVEALILFTVFARHVP